MTLLRQAGPAGRRGKNSFSAKRFPGEALVAHSGAVDKVLPPAPFENSSSVRVGDHEIGILSIEWGGIPEARRAEEAQMDRGAANGTRASAIVDEVSESTTPKRS